ncbi:MAG: zinc-binding dehydrogenase [Gaiella sp.]
MKAIVLHEKNGPGALRFEDVEDPVVGPGEVVVRISAAALNRRDLYVTYGMYPGIKLPCVLGSDAIGEVISVGDGAHAEVGATVVIDPTLGWGDDERAPGPSGIRILGVPDRGTFAELVAIPAVNVHPVPVHLSAHEAAALPLAGVTAFRSTVARGGAAPGVTMLVPGIGGGVATLCVQFAVACGARVFVTSTTDAKIDAAVSELGAAGGVNTTAEDWPAQLKELAGPLDVVVDSLGGPLFGQYPRLLRIGGTIVSFGATAGPVPELVLPTLFLKHIDVLGTAMGSPADFAGMLKLVAKHEIRPLVAAAYPLAETQAALELMEGGTVMGKIVVDV